MCTICLPGFRSIVAVAPSPILNRRELLCLCSSSATHSAICGEPRTLRRMKKTAGGSGREASGCASIEDRYGTPTCPQLPSLTGSWERYLLDFQSISKWRIVCKRLYPSYRDARPARISSGGRSPSVPEFNAYRIRCGIWGSITKRDRNAGTASGSWKGGNFRHDQGEILYLPAQDLSCAS